MVSTTVSLHLSLSLLLPRSSQVKVLYGGTELFDNEVRHTFHNDMMLAVASGVCIALLVFVLTSFSGRTRVSSGSSFCSDLMCSVQKCPGVDM